MPHGGHRGLSQVPPHGQNPSSFEQIFPFEHYFPMAYILLEEFSLYSNANATICFENAFRL